MKLKLLLSITFAIFVLSACQSGPAANAPANSANEQAKNSALPAANANQSDPANSSVNTASNAPANIANVTNAATPPGETPVDVIQALNEASKNKDVAALKQLFNKKSLEMIASQAKENKKSFDETLLNQQIVTLAKGITDGRGQKAEGDNATLEVRTSKNGPWQKVFFTKEDGHWKVALDKFMEEIMRQVEESTENLKNTGDEKDK